MTTFKKRIMSISKADRLSDQAFDYESDTVGGSKSDIRRLRKAARLYSYAADTYRRADMGMLAKHCFQRAAECWFAVGEEQFCKQNEIRAASIPMYWEDEQ